MVTFIASNGLCFICLVMCRLHLFLKVNFPNSLLEGDGQLAFKKLAAPTVETLMPKIETKGEFEQVH